MTSNLSRRWFLLAFAAIVVIGALIRLHNVVVLPGLRGPDGFGHFTYIRFLAETGTLPTAMSGWSFFHPPLYYAFMASIWNAADGLPAVLRLKAGTAAVALLGLSHVFVCYVLIKRRLPDNRIAQLLGVGMMAFLPVHLFSAGYLGNEALNASMTSLSLLTVVWCLDDPNPRRAALLGLVLGAALLVKFTALAAVAGAFGALALHFFFRREFSRGAAVITLVAVVTLTVSGWFYVRNVVRYGTPFQMSRETPMVSRVENYQTQGERGILEYVLFDPAIVYRPQWPRDLPLYGAVPTTTVRSALKESVWTGAYANVWFDAVGGQVIPPITHSEASRRAGQLLLALALIPTGVILFGLYTAVSGLIRKGWDDTTGAALVTFAAMITIFVYGTKSVPMHAAVKSTYLTPVSAIFGFWLALGYDRLAGSCRRTAVGVPVVCAVLAVVSISVFTLGLIVGRGYLRDGIHEPVWQNLYGIINYAGGDRARAREMFENAAARNWHLGHENVAIMAMEDGEYLESLHHFRQAAKLQKRQSFGVPEDRARFDRIAQAEYANSIAVTYVGLGWHKPAMKAAETSVTLNDSIPESSYNLGVLRVVAAMSVEKSDVEERDSLLREARADFARAAEGVPELPHVEDFMAAIDSFRRDCGYANGVVGYETPRKISVAERYPIETGTGDSHSASLNRRLRIESNSALRELEAAHGSCDDSVSSGSVAPAGRSPSVENEPVGRANLGGEVPGAP